MTSNTRLGAPHLLYAIILLFVYFTTSYHAQASTPATNSRLITDQGLFFYSGQNQACSITFNQAVMDHEDIAPVNAPFYPSLNDFSVTNTGRCQTPGTTLVAGEFVLANGKVYYSNGGGQACRYDNVPPWINTIGMRMYPSFPSDLATDVGVCGGWDGPNQYPATQPPAVNSLFLTDGGVFFNNGIGHACQITYDMLVRDHMVYSGFTYFPSLQQANLTNDGLCNPSGQLLAEGPFVTADGKIYFSNGIGHACSYGFGGGVDTTQLAMYPSFPSDLVVYDGRCGQSPYIDAVNQFGMDPSGTSQAAVQNTAAIKAALASSTTPNIYLRNGIYVLQAVPGDSNVAFRIGSNVRFTGEGTLASLDSDPTGQVIELKGALGLTLPLADSSINQGTMLIHLDNNDGNGSLVIHAGDLVQLNNFPTDPGGADTCSNTSNPGSCDYPNYSATTGLHRYRRRELLRVAAADTSSVTFETGTHNAYPAILANGASTFATWNGAQGYAFLSKINSVSNVSFQGIGFKRIEVRSFYASDFQISRGISDRANLAASSCFHCVIDFVDFDAKDEDRKLDFYEGSRLLTVTGYYHGGTCPSDCGIVKFDQAEDATVTATFAGNSYTGYEHGIMVDTNYAEDLTGFSDEPISNVTINATYQADNYTIKPDIFLTGEPWVGADLSGVTITHSGMALHFTGASNVQTTGSGTSNLAISGSSNITLEGGIYQDTKLDGDTAIGNYPSRNINLNNLTLQQVPTATGDDPWAQIFSTNQISLTNVTIDVTNGTPAAPGFFPILQVKDINGMTINGLKVKCTPDQNGLQIWTDVNVSNVTVVGGAATLPILFPGVPGSNTNTACPAQ